MRKLALLIGISLYNQGNLPPLPAAARDVERLCKVLRNPLMGNFDEVESLVDPELHEIQVQIETFFTEKCTKKDLVLLFLSGHGLKDELGNLYFATQQTRKNNKGELLTSTTISASFVKEVLNRSNCKRQVIILDCCYSGAFAHGLIAKGDISLEVNAIDIQKQLGGEGRAVLTSSASTQLSYLDKEGELSVYTQHIIEGIETGAADQDKDGVISTDELHEYACSKVQAKYPGMHPKMYVVEKGYRIIISNTPINNPEIIYRKEVEYFSSQGKPSIIGRVALDVLQEKLRLSHETTKVHEAEVLTLLQKYEQKKKMLKEALTSTLLSQEPLQERQEQELIRLKEILDLADTDFESIKTEVIKEIKRIKQKNRVKLLIKDTVKLSSLLLLLSLLILIADLLSKQSELKELKKLVENRKYKECRTISDYRSNNPLASLAAWRINDECYVEILKEMKGEYEGNRDLKKINELINLIPENNRYRHEANQLYKEWTAKYNYDRAKEKHDSCKSYSPEENLKHFKEALDYLEKIDKNTVLWKEKGEDLRRQIEGMIDTNPSCK